MEYKAISYVLYKDNPLLFGWYLRGVYFNFRLAKVLLPDYTVVVGVANDVYNQYESFFTELVANGMDVYTFEPTQRCRNMLNRFKPTDKYDRVLCRDSDSCLTWREVKEIRKWEESEKDWHGINDNPAHSIPMMGGMIGVRSRAFVGFDFNSYDLSIHGSDQNLIMERIWPIASKSFYHSVLTNREPQPDNTYLWETDLFQRYIGSAGCIDMEVVRFLQRLPDLEYWTDFEKRHKFYWYE